MANKKADLSADAGRAQVQERMDSYTEQGFRGVKVDPTPNENYTVAGVTGGAPTPETDEDLEAEANTAAGTDGGGLRHAREEAEAIEKAGADAKADS